jgi:galactarate dehydratase
VKPFYIQVHQRDNVAIIANPEGLPAGTQFSDGLALKERIPQSHKVALQHLQRGDPIRRYDQVIGTATRSIAPGSWVHDDAIELPRPPALDDLPLATAPPEPQPVLPGYAFDGFPNADGSVGTKNILGITTTVQCVAPTVEYAAQRIKNEILPRFPNVDDVVAITHTYGCGIAMDAPGAEIPIQTIRHISTHPNLGGTRCWSAWAARSCNRSACFQSNDLRTCRSWRANHIWSACKTNADSGRS